MAIHVLLDHGVRQEAIVLLTLIAAPAGIHAVAYRFPKVRIVTSAVDRELSESFYILPGVGNFGDRFFGTERDDDEAQSEGRLSPA